MRFGVRHDATRLIRQGSVASITSKGMLGDQLLEITVGNGKPIPPEGLVATAETAALAKYMQQAGRVLSAAEISAENIRTATEVLADPQFSADIRNVVRNMSEVMQMAAKGDGTFNRLLSDRKTAASFQEAMNNFPAISNELLAASENIHAITEQARRGPGLAHELIYGDKGTKLIDDLSQATAELTALVSDIRTKESTVHRLLYSDDASEMVANLTDVSEHLKIIVEEIQAGRGTLGGLLTDPSIYEDIKRLVGDLERNQVLRALVRYSIRQDEPRPKPDV